MTQDVGAQLLHCQSALELWNGARNLTCASSKARIMYFKSQLSVPKENMKMEEYLSKMKRVADQLALAGVPISDGDLIQHTLSGLNEKYDSIVCKLYDEDISWIEAQSSLLAYESRLETRAEK